MSIIWIGSGRFGAAVTYDTDAQSYITAVEAADGQSLETAVKDAINAFVVGCKTDGIWSAIKASCILAGARTLSGALVPLVGPAPTNVGSGFVSGDYDRKTGLLGNGSSKYLNSNYTIPSGDQNNCHISVHITSFPAGQAIAPIATSVPGGNRQLLYADSSQAIACLNNFNVGVGSAAATPTGLFGASRSAAANYIMRSKEVNYTLSASSGAVINTSLYVFAENRNNSPSSFSAPRLSFYSAGQSLTLSGLDARLTTLMAALAAAIP